MVIKFYLWKALNIKIGNFNNITFIVDLLLFNSVG